MYGDDSQSLEAAKLAVADLEKQVVAYRQQLFAFYKRGPGADRAPAKILRNVATEYRVLENRITRFQLRTLDPLVRRSFEKYQELKPIIDRARLHSESHKSHEKVFMFCMIFIAGASCCVALYGALFEYCRKRLFSETALPPQLEFVVKKQRRAKWWLLLSICSLGSGFLPVPYWIAAILAAFSLVMFLIERYKMSPEAAEAASLSGDAADESVRQLSAIDAALSEFDLLSKELTAAEIPLPDGAIPIMKELLSGGFVQEDELLRVGALLSEYVKQIESVARPLLE